MAAVPVISLPLSLSRDCIAYGLDAEPYALRITFLSTFTHWLLLSGDPTALC
jgi:hypothetical protein